MSLGTAKHVSGQVESGNADTAARPRRPARRAVTAAATLGFISAVAGCAAPAQAPGPAASAPASVTGARLPACAPHWPPPGRPSRPIRSPASGRVPVPVPGHPVGAVLCRYAGASEQPPAGGLAGAARVTSSAQVTRLQSAMNASKALVGTVMGCVQGDGNGAIVIIVYPAGTPDRTVVFDPACLALSDDSTEYEVSGSFGPLLVDLTGNWKHAATYSDGR